VEYVFFELPQEIQQFKMMMPSSRAWNGMPSTPRKVPRSCATPNNEPPALPLLGPCVGGGFSHPIHQQRRKAYESLIIGFIGGVTGGWLNTHDMGMEQSMD
jgi:hypothetical protein